ncbi:MAG TPA: urease accessory UreF family protein [Verrucomicrobiae bacterium]|nr:urease accessory UreF family protein [Verrucomicrobiae bacterium]
MPARFLIFFFQLLLLAFQFLPVHGKTDTRPGGGEPKARGDMVSETQLALSDAAEWLGDWHPLAEQLGSADGLLALGSVSASLRLSPVRDLRSLRAFLRQYQRQLLFPVELPSIQAAHGHTARKELRELVALDRQLCEEPRLRDFAGASRRVGSSQLQKLRPLRDQRMVQRYLQAVSTGAAQGWHTLVYGLTLEVYSLPLRQGLLGYAHQTTRGFLYSASRSLGLSERQCRALFDELGAELPQAIEDLLRQPIAA